MSYQKLQEGAMSRASCSAGEQEQDMFTSNNTVVGAWSNDEPLLRVEVD